MISVFQEWDILREKRETNETKENQTFASVIPKKIGVQINEARIKRRMTIITLANLIDKDSHTVALYENGLETPEQHIIEKIQEILQIDFKISM